MKGFQLKKAHVYSTFASIYPGFSKLYWIEQPTAGSVCIYYKDFLSNFAGDLDNNQKCIQIANNWADMVFNGTLYSIISGTGPAISTNTYKIALQADLSSQRELLNIGVTNTGAVSYQFISDDILFPDSIHEVIGFNTGTLEYILKNNTLESQPFYTSYLSNQTNALNTGIPQVQYKNSQFYPGLGHILVDFVERRSDCGYHQRSWRDQIVGTFYGFDSGTYITVENHFEDVISFDNPSIDIKSMKVSLVDYCGRQIAQMDNMPNFFEFIVYTK